METNEPKTFLGTTRYLSHTFTTSNTIAYCKYDSLLLSLLVIFHNGTEYEYSGVDSTSYEELIAAPSAGSYFSKFLRKHKFVRTK
jgi:hypothetical protein